MVEITIPFTDETVDTDDGFGGILMALVPLMLGFVIFVGFQEAAQAVLDYLTELWNSVFGDNESQTAEVA